ncbi:MAG: hypothetical protein AAB909_01595 [Patescibacteria group bacterium]
MIRSSRPETDVFLSHSDNFFAEVQAANAVVPPLFEKIYHRPFSGDAKEKAALAAVAATMYSDGDLQRLAETGAALEPSDTERQVISLASLALTRNPQFTRELYNGDATPLVEASILKARERVG